MFADFSLTRSSDDVPFAPQIRIRLTFDLTNFINQWNLCNIQTEIIGMSRMADDKIDWPDAKQVALSFVLGDLVGPRLRKATWKENW